MSKCNKKCGCKMDEVVYCKPIVVVEKPVYCCEEKTFYHVVEHIQPVIVKEVENHVYKHEYKMDKKVCKEERRIDEGKKHIDWCQVAKEERENYKC